MALPDEFRKPYEVITDANRLPYVAQQVASSSVIGLDLETTSLSPHHGEIRICSISTPTNVYVIDLFQTKTLQPVQQAIEDAKPIVVGQNTKFDQKWLLHKFNLELWPVFDTYRASAIIHNGLGLGHNLYNIYARELGINPQVEDQGDSRWDGPLSPEQYQYAAEDVTFLHVLRDKLKLQLTQHGLNKIALLEFGAILPEASIELNGFYLNKVKWARVYDAAKKEYQRLREELSSELPHPKKQLGLFNNQVSFNIGSTQQLQQSLAILGLNVDSTEEKVLAMKAAEFPIVKKLIEYKKASKKISSFGMKYLRHIDAATGRIHTGFYPFTDAGRYSSVSPNLQQLPREKAYRECFEPEEGGQFILADYSQIELRTVAEISGDATLLRVYANNEDAHQETASIVNDIPKTQVTKFQRQLAKPINFGLIYGLGAEKLVIYAQTAYGVSMTLGQAKEFRKKYFEGYPGVARWHGRVFSVDKAKQETRTILGRRRLFDGIDAHNEYANCVDMETEILTSVGWKRGDALRVGDSVLTKNKDSGILEWQPVLHVHVYPDHFGEFIEFSSRSFSAVSTSNHRWLVWNKTTCKDECKTSSEISVWGDHRIHRTGMYTSARNEIYSDDFLRLCGWFLTDGSFRYHGRKHNRPMASIMQSNRAKPQNVQYIDNLLMRLGVTPWRSRPSKGAEQIVWFLPVDVSIQLHELFPTRVLTMAFILSLSKDQLHCVLETMMLGDGCQTEAAGKKSFCAGTLEKATLFQILSYLCGYIPVIEERDFRGKIHTSPKLNAPIKGGIHWIVRLNSRDKAQVTKEQRRVFSGKMTVWCPAVANTFFVAKREGNIFITGNSPVQGSAADGLKIALRDVYFRMKKFGKLARMVHMVHDEIIVESGTKDKETNEAMKLELETGMKDAMQKVLTRVPVEAEGSIGDSWADK